MKPFKILFTIFLSKFPSRKGVTESYYWCVFCPLLLPGDTEWFKTTWIRMPWFTPALKTQLNISFSWILFVVVCTGEQYPNCNLNGYCSYFCHYQMTFGFFCHCLSQLFLISVRSEPSVKSVSWSSLLPCSNLKNQKSCWLWFPSLLRPSFWTLPNSTVD